mgnify:FL=1|tara:strand:+ start:134 stop:550 length:417 start_codon:yes stop_codon:yes gene_type:complete
MTESEIWQVIQAGNEISVMRIQVFITITVGVLVISSINVVRLNAALLCILLSSYLLFGYLNFSMTMAEMDILAAGMSQIRSMVAENKDVSLMGQYLASQLDTSTTTALVPAMHITYWSVTISTIIYAIWRYRRQSEEA